MVLVAALGWAQANGDRLILKDGTYQVITKYEIKGDRVRYFSAEREDWEEVPVSEVDWAATAKWKHDYGAAGNADQVTPQTSPDGQTQTNTSGQGSDPEQVEAAKIDAEERAARAAEMARIPFVLPGLRLPDESGVWVLDTFDGRPELAHIMQANGDLNREYEHSVQPYEVGSKAGARELVRVNGYSAPVELHVNQPVFYVSLNIPMEHPNFANAGNDDNGPAELGHPLTVDTRGASSVPDDKHAFSSPDSRYVVVSLTVGKNLRSATAQAMDGILRGEHSVELTETTKEILPGGRWMKVTPRGTLLIGQYALVEVLSPRNVNLDVWAFGVDPRAPENKGTVGAVEQR
jgi:hypothetical protein